jgi:hypothetical protein
MAINPSYIPLFTIEEVILDKDSALPLAAGVVTFYRDSQRTVPKDVFMISGTSPSYTFTDIGNQLVLGISGTFVDSNGDPFVPYAYPYDVDGNLDLYYVTVESAGGVPQFVRQAVPYVPANAIPPSEQGNTENILCNPQFVEVNFPSAATIILNVTGTNTVTPIAPGWDIISTGSGTLTIQRLQPTADNIITNPPYILSINASSAFGASVILRQRLNNSPSIFRGDFVSANFIAAVLSGGGSNMSLTYAPDTGTPTTIIPSTNIPTDGAYHQIFANAAIPQQINDPADTGYVDIQISIPTSRTIGISSIQVVGTSFSTNIPFDEQSSDRQKDHLFHYYEDASVHQPKTNLLAGWTFGLNPWQFYAVTHGNVATNEYTADQTIIIQQNYVASATGNNVAVSQGSVAQNYGYLVTAVTATNKFALLQYIDPSSIRPYWGKTLSVMLSATAIIGAGHTTTPKFKIRLMYRAGLPATVSQTNPVSAWTDVDDSIPTLTGWTYLTAINDPEYTLTSNKQDFAFNGFVLPASSDANMTLGIMVIMMNDLNSAATADAILFDKVSLVNNDFAVKGSAETYEQALSKCQYYFRKTYAKGVLPGTSDANGATSIITTAAYTAPFIYYSERFNNMRSNGYNVTFYSAQTGTAGKIFDFTDTADLSADTTNQSDTAFTVRLNTNVPSANARLQVHYTVDARLGT